MKKRILICAVLLTTLAVLGTGSTSASAAGAGGAWFHLTSRVRPAILPRGGEGFVELRALNLGDAIANGAGCAKVGFGTGAFADSECTIAAEPGKGEFEKTPVVLTATLPEGVSVQKEPGERPRVSVITFPESEEQVSSKCSEPKPREIQCRYEAPLAPYTYVEISVAVDVEAGAVSGRSSSAEVTGAGAGAVHIERALKVGEPGEPVLFGVEDDSFSVVPEEEGGAVAAQAGSHPFQLTTNLALNQTNDTLKPPALPKKLQFTLPPGLVGNAVAFPRCSELDFLTKGFGGFDDLCPENTAIGVVDVTVHQAVFGAERPFQTYPIPLFNLAPKQGEPVRFGFFFIGIPVPIDFSVRTGGDYGATATVDNITQIADFLSESLTIWGVPGEAVHDASRGWGCIGGGFYSLGGRVPCIPADQTDPPPFLTLPTDCQEPWQASVAGESWPKKADPETPAESIPLAAGPQNSYSLEDAFGREIGLTGCNQLAFDPLIEISPDVQQASTSTGLAVRVKVPQEVNENARGLASSSVKDITVALPVGVQINPSGGNGLQACGEGQVGFEAGRGENGFEEFPSEPGVRNPLFTPTVPEPLSPGLNLGALGFCASASKIGTVKIKSPLIANPLEGSAYIATQNQNPFGSLLALYIVAEDPVSGVLVKLPGKTSLCQSAGEVIAGETCGAPGQIVTTFENEPELPFEEATFEFFGGERAPLATPAHCGTYTTGATFTPWSATQPVSSTSAFQITRGPDTASEPDGSPCPGASLPFSPSLTGGGLNTNAGAFTPLSTTIGREDGQQNISGIALRFPPGLSGLLSSVTLCGEQQANEGKCPESSEIGETTVSAGVGQDPVAVKGGKVYITEKYHGAPFGLSIVNPVKAGPFDLEHDTSNPATNMPPCDCIVVRAKIEVNPYTAALTVTCNSEGEGYGIPHLIDGIPVQIKKINVLINRPGFTFNPTNGNTMKIEGTIPGVEGGSAPVSVPFQVSNVERLKFTPKISFSTNGKTSKKDGADLITKVSEPAGSLGTQANLAKVKVELPKALPSRLTTLQKACTDKQFELNPAACPAESKIGYATVHTPLLPVPLTGPAIFVSHGGEAFPSLTMVLQGYGVTIDLVGTTFISKKGITSTTFKTVPDQPFSTFELTLPQGKYSALAANVPAKNHGSLCGTKLVIPNEFVSQAGGAPVKQDSVVAVSGCKKLTAAQVRAEKLKAALGACHKRYHKRARREACERTARKRFGPVRSQAKHRVRS